MPLLAYYHHYQGPSQLGNQELGSNDLVFFQVQQTPPQPDDLGIIMYTVSPS